MKDKKILIEMGERIKSRRKQIGLSQIELAQKVGYTSKSTISLIENGKRDISSAQLKKIATALDTTVDYLMGLNEIIDIHFIYDDEIVKQFQNIFSTYYVKLTEENKKDAEDYLKFLLEKQN